MRGTRGSIFGAVCGVAVALAASGARAEDVEIAVSGPAHRFETLLGGATWLFSRAVTREHARALAELPGDLLVEVKRDAAGFGYRFDLDEWDPSTEEHGYFSWDGTDAGTPTDLDDLLAIYEEHPRSRVHYHVPLPAPGTGFAWQTPELYAAELQYLFGEAGPEAEWAGLPLALDFFSEPASFNWAGLRARRGRPEPYRAEAVVLGEEPYFIEGWAQDGAGFGARAEACRAALRARGLALPYGVHVSQLPPTDPERTWFGPMMDALEASDPPGLLDLFHYYTLAGTPDWERGFPVAVKDGGFENWWVARESWASDYTRFLWLVEDTRHALGRRGTDPATVSLGWSEHGIRISTPFMYNDMAGALHWASWIAETMRLEVGFDSVWVLGAEGWSTALVQVRDGVTTRTPAFHVQRLARSMLGMTVLEADYESPVLETTDPGGGAVTVPWLVVRVLAPGSGPSRHLYAVNHHPTETYRLTGFEDLRIARWEEVRGESYAAENPLGLPGPEPVQLAEVPHAPDSPIDVLPISVAHVVLEAASPDGDGDADSEADAEAEPPDGGDGDADAPSTDAEAGGGGGGGCGCSTPAGPGAPNALVLLAPIAVLLGARRPR